MSPHLRHALPLAALLWAGTALLWGGALAGLDVPPAAPDLSAVAAEAAAQVRQMMPTPATTAPPATALDGARGSAVEFARADHTHAARVQRTVLVTATDGTATWVFARPITVPAGKLPPITNMVEDTGSPVVVQIIGRTLTSDGTTDTHTAVGIKAQRSQLLPGVLVSLSALLNFNVFGGPVSGVRVNIWAADPTQ